MGKITNSIIYIIVAYGLYFAPMRLGELNAKLDVDNYTSKLYKVELKVDNILRI